MARVIEEVTLIHAHRTKSRRRHPVSEHFCALCQSDRELISVAAAARIGRVNPLRLREWLVFGLASAREPLSLETLVCLDCLSRCRMMQLRERK
jgi:hypothetical protein